MRPNHPVYLKLRRMTKHTMRVTPPADYLRRFGLTDGDELVWIEEEDGVVRVKPLKAEEPPQSSEPATAEAS